MTDISYNEKLQRIDVLNNELWDLVLMYSSSSSMRVCREFNARTSAIKLCIEELEGHPEVGVYPIPIQPTDPIGN